MAPAGLQDRVDDPGRSPEADRVPAADRKLPLPAGPYRLGVFDQPDPSVYGESGESHVLIRNVELRVGGAE